MTYILKRQGILTTPSDLLIFKETLIRSVNKVIVAGGCVHLMHNREAEVCDM